MAKTKKNPYRLINNYKKLLDTYLKNQFKNWPKKYQKWLKYELFAQMADPDNDDDRKRVRDSYPVCRAGLAKYARDFLFGDVQDIARKELRGNGSRIVMDIGCGSGWAGDAVRSGLNGSDWVPIHVLQYDRVNSVERRHCGDDHSLCSFMQWNDLAERPISVASKYSIVVLSEFVHCLSDAHLVRTRQKWNEGQPVIVIEQYPTDRMDDRMANYSSSGGQMRSPADIRRALCLRNSRVYSIGENSDGSATHFVLVGYYGGQ